MQFPERQYIWRDVRKIDFPLEKNDLASLPLFPKAADIFKHKAGLLTRLLLPAAFP